MLFALKNLRSFYLFLLNFWQVNCNTVTIAIKIYQSTQNR